MAAPTPLPIKKRKNTSLPYQIDVAFPNDNPPPSIVGFNGVVYGTPLANPNIPTVYRYTLLTQPRPSGIDESSTGGIKGKSVHSSKSSGGGDRVPPIVVAEIAPRTPKIRNSW